MAEIRQVTIKVRDRQVDGGLVPSTAVMAEPFVNLYNGVLRFSGVTGGDYEESSQTGVFEVGSKLFNSSISNRLNINDNFIISGDTGLISTYGGASGAGLDGKVLSGTASGFVLADFSDIQAKSAGNGGDIQFNDGSDGFAADGSLNYISGTGTLRVPSFSATTMSAGTDIFSGGTSLETIIYNIANSTETDDITRVQPGANILTAGTGNLPIVRTVDSPSFNNIEFSGTATGGNASFVDMSASTLYSGATDVEDIIYNIATTISGVHTYIQDGTNTVTGGTEDLPTVNLVDSPSVNNLLFSGTATGGNVFASEMSGGTLYSGSTDLYDIFLTSDEVSGTTVSEGSNISVNQSGIDYEVSLVDSPFVDEFTASGSSVFEGSVTVTGLTDTRVVFAGAGGVLTDDAGMTYDSSTDVLTVDGNFTTNGTQYSGGTIQDDGIFTLDAATRVEVDSDLLPTSHLTYDLGQPGQRWDELYVRKVRLGTSSTTLEDQLFSSTTGDFKFDFAGDLYINNNTYPEADISYDMGKSSNRWKTGYFQDVDMLGDLSATALTVSNLTQGRVVYAGVGGLLTDEAGFEYDETSNTVKAGKIQIGNPGDTGTTTTVFGDILVIGQSISGFTSELYIEDNLIELNYNPSASTESTSLGAGWAIQDGSGSAGTDVLWDIRGAATGVDNRSFTTNLHDIRIRETGTISSPNGLRLIAETDCIDGGTY